MLCLLSRATCSTLPLQLAGVAKQHQAAGSARLVRSFQRTFRPQRGRGAANFFCVFGVGVLNNIKIRHLPEMGRIAAFHEWIYSWAVGAMGVSILTEWCA